jgi:hypothetical protein
MAIAAGADCARAGDVQLRQLGTAGAWQSCVAGDVAIAAGIVATFRDKRRLSSILNFFYSTNRSSTFQYNLGGGQFKTSLCP